MEIGTQLVINAGGLEGSERLIKNGLVVFGKKSIQGQPNDFNFPDDENASEKQFEIKFDRDLDDYFIKDLHGTGLFMKILNKQILKHNAIFSFVSTHILVEIPLEIGELVDGDYETIQSKLILKVLHGINKGEVYEYNSLMTDVIRIGRFESERVHIAFNEDSVSRCQCSLIFEDCNWFIIDGDGIKSSENGTWLLADQYTRVTEGMVIRTGDTSFECSYISPL